MIIICTDYGSSIYTGQVIAKITSIAPKIPVINAIDDLPVFNAKASAYLLNALVRNLPETCIIVAVVDPSVGGKRAPICFKHGSRWFIGPDNGLFSRIVRNADALIFRIDLDKCAGLSPTFHGRDLFGPAAAALSLDESSLSKTKLKNSATVKLAQRWPDNLNEIIYIDSFGNGMSGISAESLCQESVLRVNGVEFKRTEKFCDVAPGDRFWYENSLGLAEVALNQDSAASKFGLLIGTPISIT